MTAAASNERPDLEYGVLGPLRVTRSGTSLSLGGPQQRAVLALLLLEANKVVSVSHLADALWGDCPPVRLITTVQTYVFHLREVLEPGRHRGTPARVLVTESGGYRLQVGDGSVDAAVFERRVRSGQAMVAQGAFAEAADELERALDLWRGDVLADLAHFAFVASFARRLEEVRLSAIESKIDAELALGRHVSVVPELDELVGRYPLRERMQAQRMLALYRSGRQSDALTAYHGLRRVLDEELGIEPSAPLQQLHRAVLAQDPDLAWDPPPAPAGIDNPMPAASRVVDAPVPTPRPDAGRRRRPSRRWVIGGAALATLASVGAVSATVIGHSPGSNGSALPANSVGVLNADGSLRHEIQVGQGPDGLAYGAGAVWVSNGSDGTVSRINPHTHAVVQTISVGSSPTAITVTGEDVWVVNGGDGTVSEIDALSNTVVGRPIQVGNLPTAIASGPSGVWVANTADDTVLRIDPATGAVSSPIAVGGQPDGIAVGPQTVWVANGQDGTVSQIDPQTGNVASPIAVGAGPKGIAVTDDAVWVANSGEQSVDRIDPRSGDVVATVPVGDGPNAIVTEGGAIWVSDEYDSTVDRIDSVDDRKTATITTGSSPRGLVLVDSSPWVAFCAFTTAAHRGGTLTVETSFLPGNQGIDPAGTGWRPTIMAEHLVYDGLVGLRQTGGPAGVSLVPDLATTVPSPTDGGRTYTFTLRRGVRYSTGKPVRPEDIRRGLQRVLTLSPSTAKGYYSAIVGAPSCVSSPLACDLSRGVVTDDATSSVIFHLTAPDPDFLYELSNHVVATPPGAPVSASTSPLPATGPYLIAKYQPGEDFTLVRNPYFHQWSFAAQPAGYPDQIRWHRAPSGSSTVADILAGRADLTDLQSLRLPQDVLTNFARSHPTQLRAAYGMTEVDEFLNTRVPPFNDVRVRRAVNYAVDRVQLTSLWGGSTEATPSCQLLPPSMPAYQPYCPYTVNPQSDGTYHGPDLHAAQVLVAASGTIGTPVTVWGVTGARDHAVNEYFTSLLRRLGYRASLRELANYDAYFAKVADSRSRVQMGTSWWGADFPAPSTFYLPMLSCNSYQPMTTSNDNYSEYCSEYADELVAQARALQVVDPAGARRLWAQVDRTVTNEAPCVSIMTLRNSALVSTRLRNFQANPVLGPLFDQVWIQ
jgi:YVTN family beta-propeller protein